MENKMKTKEEMYKKILEELVGKKSLILYSKFNDNFNCRFHGMIIYGKSYTECLGRKLSIEIESKNELNSPHDVVRELESIGVIFEGLNEGKNNLSFDKVHLGEGYSPRKFSIEESPNGSYYLNHEFNDAKIRFVNKLKRRVK